MTLNLIDPVIGIEAHMVNPVALRCIWGRGSSVNNGQMPRYDAGKQSTFAS